MTFPLKVQFYFHDIRSRFSWCQVEILVMTGREFHDSRSRFSLWQAEIFMITGLDFHGTRSRFFVSFLVLIKETTTRSESKDFNLLLLVLIERIRRQGESKISLRNPSVGKLPPRPLACYNKLLGRRVSVGRNNSVMVGTFIGLTRVQHYQILLIATFNLSNKSKRRTLSFSMRTVK